MIVRDDLPATPEWKLPAGLHSDVNEALTMPLLWDGDQA
jgi:hypothetical protein